MDAFHAGVLVAPTMSRVIPMGIIVQGQANHYLSASSMVAARRSAVERAAIAISTRMPDDSACCRCVVVVLEGIGHAPFTCDIPLRTELP